jgi:outer membrane protein assembly factor BamB
MHLNRSMKFSLTLSVIFFLIVGFFIPSTVIAIYIDPLDGIWTDSFEDKDTTYRPTNGTSRCIWEDGTILLARTSDGGRNYTFKDQGSFKNNDHKAYYYQTALPIKPFSFLFSPLTHTERAEREFDADFQYPNIENFNESSNRYVETSASGFKRYVVHHFRMKLDGNADTIGNLDIYWYGKAENAGAIDLYYWQYRSLSILSSWILINSTDKEGDTILFANLSNTELKAAIGRDNYIDICVVTSNPLSGCTLYTDYVKLRSRQQEGYQIGYGLVQTNSTIDLASNTYWDLLAWDDYQGGSASIRYQVLYKNETTYVPVENAVLNGNEQGFTTSPVSLVPLAADLSLYKNIKIRANLTTNNPSVSPKIYSWTLTWQKSGRWQDLFNSEYRIDTKNKLTRSNGAFNISPVSGDWPMFGQNPENTRASQGKAAHTRDLYWWSNYHELMNETINNIIVDGETLYLSTINSGAGSLYTYDTILVPSDKIGKSYTDIYPGLIHEFSNLSFGKPIVGSPAISDEYLVVATGEKASRNYVYGFKKNAPTSDPVWKFDYGINNTKEPNICYWGSPIIAERKVYLTSWGGEATLTGYHINNMILALDLETGKLLWNYSFPAPAMPLQSPSWSFSTPVFSDGKVIAGNMNDAGANLFAFEAVNGSLLWNTSVGAIGKAAPVVYNNTVYIVSELKTVDGIAKKTKVSAINIDDGSIRWNVTLGRTLITPPSFDLTYCLAQSTPAIANNVLYVTSPDGWVTALDISKNGTGIWAVQLYTKLLPSYPILDSSPSYADGILYVGTPDGFVYALNTATNGSTLWSRQTFPYDQMIPVSAPPIVSNGLVFFGAENGRLYVCGAYVKPEEPISGSVTSVPIQLPEGYWWKKFYAVVKTNASGSINKITFSLLDEQKNVLKVLQNGSDLLMNNQTLDRTLRLRADFWAKNSSENPILYSWNVTFEVDTSKPYLDISTFTPNPEGWLHEVVPTFTIKAKDNITGLLVSSARYWLEYVANNQTFSYSSKALCTGSNGTIQNQTITVNISSLDFFNNISALRSLRIDISDLAGNTASKTVTFKQDTIKPSSSVKSQGMKQRYNATASSIRINATASDNGTDASGIQRVDLYYRYAETRNFSGSWTYYANSTRKLPSWSFNFTKSPTQHGGYFELCTVATDNASNNETFPAQGDVWFLYDWKMPELPTEAGGTLWYKEKPMLSVTFEDDYRLDTIQYRPNFDTAWTTIASKINKNTYNAIWSLKEEYWDQMEESETYHLYFKINDTLGNTRLITSDSQAITIRKDTSVPTVTIDIPTLQDAWSWADNFTVTAQINDRDGSGIKQVSLYYRYSEDNSNWTTWKTYGSDLHTSPFEWAFEATDGDGYYEFKINATDNAGNNAESEVFASGINTFPTTLVMIMIVLVAILILISAMIFIKWKKRKP